MKVLITGGGTAGHVNPAIAIAQILQENHPDAELAFTGTKKGIENKLVAAEGFPIYHTEVRGFSRSLHPKNLYALWLMLVSPHKAKRILREFRPDLIVGTGGYVSWPIVKAGAKMKIPTALHESNAVPGLAVKLLERHVDRILLNFKESASYLKYPEKAIHVGNPLRRGFHTQKSTYEKNDGRLRILSFGGSLGADAINRACLDLMQRGTLPEGRFLHLHGTGERNYEACRTRYDQSDVDRGAAKIVPYITDMPTRMAEADIVIARAGAMTLSEIARMGKACILIPSPNVTDNHQYKNAKMMADKGACILLEEKDLSGESLAKALLRLAENEEKRRDMENACKQFAIEDANRKVYDALMQCMSKKKK